MEPDIDFFYPIRIVSLNYRVTPDLYTSQQFANGILPITVTDPVDFEHLAYVSIGAVNLILFFYRLLLVSFVLSLSFLATSLYRWRKPFYAIAVVLILAVTSVAAIALTGGGAWMLLDPYSLIQGKGPLSFIHALFLMMILTVLVYVSSRFLANRDMDVTS